MPDNGDLPFASLEVSDAEKSAPPPLLRTCEDSSARMAAVKAAPKIASLSSVYWSPEELSANPPDPSALPPREILATVLDHVGLSLRTRTQHLASRSTDISPVEPALALYCPIEGGDYVIDATVREIARRFKADVIVLDTVHMAAAEVGHYAETGALMNFSDNPLHDRTPRKSGCQCSSCVPRPDDDPDDVGSPSSGTPSSGNSPHSPMLFFDLLVNLTSASSSGANCSRRPRIIYVRDQPTLVSSLSDWWPMLQHAVHLRRSSSSSSAVENKTLLIIGATPPGTSALKLGGNDDDSEEDTKREKALREAWKEWAGGDKKLFDDVSCLKVDKFQDCLPSNATSTIILRKSVIIPATRAPPREAATRSARRREFNMLTMKIAAASLGASLPATYSPKEDEEDKMWDEWGRQRFSWNVLRYIVECAVGSAELAAADDASEDDYGDGSSPLVLSWDNIRLKWSERSARREIRKTWAESSEKNADEEKDEENDEEKTDEAEAEKDEIVEKVKNADDLSKFERDLLVCIVDPASMTTTFDDVHLPAQTVDAVRTLASLPLLQPDAFKQGILKQNAMTGSLLFGPPGVGKTHLVRALAKGCGARMLSVQPSHIVQVYMGEGEKCVRAIFSLARRLSPCVMFIDELDAMFPERSNNGSSASKAYRAILTEFLQEMDGLLSKKDGVIIVGATNRPFDLDDAVLRRLPVRILVELPGEAEREAILKIHLRDEQIDEDVDIKRLAKETDRFSGSDLKYLVISAALDAVKENVTLPWRKDAAKLDAESATKEGGADATPQSSEASAARETSKESPEASASTEPSEDPAAAPKEAPSAPEPTLDDKVAVLEQPAARRRILRWRNFAQALTEIWPSASEHLGTYAKLQEWNDKFGSGGRQRKGDDLQNPTVDHDSALGKVRRAFDITETEQTLLRCAVDPAAIKTTFADVHLPPETVDAVRTIVSLPLMQPDAFAQGILKEHGMRGSLLFGPPGTGKTHLVRALARESGAHMLVIKPSDMLDRWLGQSEKLVAALFGLARRLSPCIIFIDEIDALFSERASDGSSGTRAYRAVLTEFMQEMDGLLSNGKNVIVIGATNRPFDLDDALLRRLPLRLLVDLPGQQEREEILKILLRSETLAEDVDLKKIARDTAQFSGSDLKHLVVGAALEAVKESVNLPWKTATSDTWSGVETGLATPPSGIVEVPPEEDIAANATATAATSTSIPGDTSMESLKTQPPRMLYGRHFARARRGVQPSASEHMSTHGKLREWGRKFGTGAEKNEARDNTASGWSSSSNSTADNATYPAGGQGSKFSGGQGPAFSRARDSMFAGGSNSSYGNGPNSYAGGSNSYAGGPNSYANGPNSSYTGGPNSYADGKSSSFAGSQDASFANGFGSTFASSGWSSNASSGSGGSTLGSTNGMDGEAGKTGIPGMAGATSKGLDEILRSIRERDEKKRGTGA